MRTARSAAADSTDSTRDRKDDSLPVRGDRMLPVAARLRGILETRGEAASQAKDSYGLLQPRADTLITPH